MASSGIAAELLDGGRTAHSRFKIPIPILDTSTCNIPIQSSLAELIRIASIIIWDEAPMMHRYVFECVHRTLCDIMKSDNPFGGKIVLLGGDFRQVLPVIRHGSQANVIFSSLQHSFLWTHVCKLHLTINMRVHTLTTGQCSSNADTSFERFILNIGNGTEKYHTQLGISKIRLPSKICIAPDESGLDNLIKRVYPDLHTKTLDQKICNRAVLSATNERVDFINQKIMETFKSDSSEVYLSADSVHDPSQTYIYPTEFLNSLTPSGLPPHCLFLKKYSPIILIRNLNPKEGLLNGTKLAVINLGRRIIEAKIMTGKHSGKMVFLPRITLTPSDSGLPFQLQRRQFPVRPAFSMTINKCQSQTLEYVGIDLTQPIFTHGQLYVALSRVRSFDYVSILPDLQCIDCYYTDNVVYKDVLL